VRADLEAELAAQRMRADETDLYRVAQEARRADERTRAMEEHLLAQETAMAARAEMERALAEQQALEVERDVRHQDAMDRLRAREVELAEVERAMQAAQLRGDLAAQEALRVRELLGEIGAGEEDPLLARERYLAALETYQRHDPAAQLDRWRRIDELREDADDRLDFTEGDHRIDFTEGDGGSGAIRILIEGLPPGRKNIEFEIEDLEGGHDAFFHEGHSRHAHEDPGRARPSYSWSGIDADGSHPRVLQFSDEGARFEFELGDSGHDAFEFDAGDYGEFEFELDSGDHGVFEFEIDDVDLEAFEFEFGDCDSEEFQFECEDLSYDAHELDFSELGAREQQFWIEADDFEEDPESPAAAPALHAFWTALAAEDEDDDAGFFPIPTRSDAGGAVQRFFLGGRAPRGVEWRDLSVSDAPGPRYVPLGGAVDDEALLLELRDLVQEIRADVHELRDSVRNLRAEVRGRSGGRR
jgi:hypothetical protein